MIFKLNYFKEVFNTLSSHYSLTHTLHWQRKLVSVFKGDE